MCTENGCFIGEKAELKTVLNKKYGNFKVKDIRSSKLWLHMQGERKKDVEVFVVEATKLKCSRREGKGQTSGMALLHCESYAGCDEHYNSVWEEELGLCYSILHCPATKCQQVTGLLIHATSIPSSQKLVGKVSCLFNYDSTVMLMCVLLQALLLSHQTLELQSV